MNLLAIGAHPDDVELGCGGSLAAAAGHGHTVTLADLTRGEMASAGTPEIRAGEAREAARILGVTRVNLEFPDGGVLRHDPDQERALVELVRSVRPSLVLAPLSGDRHPDHEETHHLVRRVVFLAGLRRYPAAGDPWRPDALYGYPGSRQLTGPPPVVVDISATWEQKLGAIDCYRSQFVRSPGGPATPINAPDFRGWIEARALYFGQLVGVARGEALYAERPLPVRDPLTLVGAAHRVETASA